MAEPEPTDDPGPGGRPYKQWEWRSIGPLLGISLLLVVLLVILAIQTYNRL